MPHYYSDPTEGEVLELQLIHIYIVTVQGKTSFNAYPLDGRNR